MNSIKILRKSKGYSQGDVANAIGVTQSQYSRYESGSTNIPGDMLAKIADFFSISVDQLIGREYSSADPDDASTKRQIPVKPAASTIQIPLVGSFRCGYNHNGEEFLQYDQLDVLPSFYKRYGPDLIAYIAVGSSMMPTIHPGDLMYAVKGDIWEDGDIVALVIDDAETIKRIYHAPDGGLDIIPDNETFRKIHLSPKDVQIQQVSVLARIVKIERDL